MPLPQNQSLLLDLYELTMAQSFFTYRAGARATFDLFVRNLPQNRGYLIACGLEDILNYIRGLKFTKGDIAYLRAQKIFSPDFLRYLSGLKFSGDLWALPEGEVFFANEPVIRVTAPIIEAQIVESFLLNTINLQTMIASKAARVVSAAKERGVYDFSLRRTHGTDAAIKVARASFIAGCRGTSNVLAGKLYHIPVVGTMAHSYVMSFKHEIDSFLAYANTFPGKAILLADTYDTKKGIKNAVTTGLYLKEKGFRLKGVRLDSGDLVSLSKFSRRQLDAAGLDYAGVFASGNLDEFKINGLLKRGAKIDNFGVGTNMGVSLDAPALDVIYKISEVTDEDGNFLPTMKLSKDKATFPGRKQVFRILDKQGNFLKDIIGLEKEKIAGRPLLKKVVDKGKIIYKQPSLEKIRSYTTHNLTRLPQKLKAVYPQDRYPVEISPGIMKLRTSLMREIENRQYDGK